MRAVGEFDVSQTSRSVDSLYGVGIWREEGVQHFDRVERDLLEVND